MTDISLLQLTISPTQVELFERCHRAWYFEKREKLPTVNRGSTVFGTIVHAVIERWLNADELGRGKDGKPVDLYPDGWHIAYDKYKPDKIDGEIDSQERMLVKALVEKAIEEGILVRNPVREVEREFRLDVIPGVSITGFIDLEHVGEIVDHKTTKAAKWMLSSKQLSEKTQALLYSHVHVDSLRKEGAAIPPEIKLVHNYFLKDPNNPQVRKVTATAPLAKIAAKWEEVKQIAEQMQFYARNVQDALSEIPDPPNMAAACNAYGGCQFTHICGKRETTQEYRKRLASAGDSAYSGNTKRPPMVATGDSDMTLSWSAKLAESKAAKGKPAAPAPAGAGATSVKSLADKMKPSAPAAAPTAKAPSTQRAELDAPPWANPTCPICGGTGFSKTGSACPVCAVKARKEGISISDFALTPNADGTITWVHKADPDTCGVSPWQGAPADVKVKEEIEENESDAPAIAETNVEPAGDEDGPVVDDPSEAEEETEGDAEEGVRVSVKSSGRPKKSFTLVINAVVAKCPNERKGSGRYVWDLIDVMDAIAQQISEENGGKDYYSLNAFERRDKIMANGDAIADQFKIDIVTVQGISPGASDLRTLVDAIRPHAGVVIIGSSY